MAHFMVMVVCIGLAGKEWTVFGTKVNAKRNDTPSKTVWSSKRTIGDTASFPIDGQ